MTPTPTPVAQTIVIWKPHTIVVMLFLVRWTKYDARFDELIVYTQFEISFVDLAKWTRFDAPSLRLILVFMANWLIDGMDLIQSLTCYDRQCMCATEYVYDSILLCDENYDIKFGRCVGISNLINYFLHFHHSGWLLSYATISSLYLQLILSRPNRMTFQLSSLYSITLKNRKNLCIRFSRYHSCDSHSIWYFDVLLLVFLYELLFYLISFTDIYTWISRLFLDFRMD